MPPKCKKCGWHHYTTARCYTGAKGSSTRWVKIAPPREPDQDRTEEK